VATHVRSVLGDDLSDPVSALDAGSIRADSTVLLT
jgi:hypothetical protein